MSRTLLPLALLTFTAPASAFTVESAFSDGCHEQITEAALRNVRASLPTAATIAPNDDERALIGDLPFTVPSDMTDLASASVLVGVRDNDLKGYAPTDIEHIAIVQANPTLQHEHCLRESGDTEPGGSTAALARCGTFIHDRAMSAVSTLGVSGAPNPTLRDDVRVGLSVRGPTDVRLPAFWVRIGQALHALQDAYAHTYRTEDGSHVTVVLDWVDLVDKQLDESVDGPPHKMDLDRCNAGDDIRNRNKASAIAASTALLRAALNPSLGASDKSMALGDVVASSLAYSPGCSYGNAWCNAPENSYTQLNALGCEAGGSGGSAALTSAAIVGLVVVLVVARRRKRFLALTCVLAPLLAPTAARADGEEKPPKIAVAGSIAGSAIDPAVAGALGFRVLVSPHFILGVDAELNAWYGLNGSRFDVGAASLYATGIARYPVLQRLALRTTFNLGGTVETVDLPGVPAGSFGFFAGVYPLGVEWRASKHVFVILNPLGFAIPVTHLTGSPFGYPQFRTQLGIELAF